ncbi:hypothetical protein [Haloferula rosea]|uniref:Uncharacterized protein n=1 Tax=Haloferula rosea TaxID=490093 RepID=A0A934RE18_9BACT|nr:hypothetical protein [Haloferula rosea]MBK1829058.1 hypothetical protein [Haloferula rosea]
MHFLALIAGLSLVGATFAEDEPKTHLGVFSNEAEEFTIVTMMIHEGGLAYFHAAVSGQIGEWEFDETSSTLSMKFLNPSTVEDQTLNLKFDQRTRSYDLIKPGKEVADDPPYELHFISDEIPDRMIEAFKAYPAQIKKIRAQMATEREFERRREEQLKRERPEYERIVAKIKAEPRAALAKEFHRKELTELGQYPADVRAFRDTLADHDVPFPEDIAIDLIEAVPDDHYSLLALLFQRPELTSKTLNRFYPKALECAHQYYGVLAIIAEHPNAPIELLEDLAARRDIPVGATNPAQNRLEKIEREKSNQ